MNEILKKLNADQPYRLSQIKKAIFHQLIENWDEAQNLPKTLRDELKKAYPLSFETKTWSHNNTTKALIDLGDVKIETVLMRHSDGRNAVCVSSQAGCQLGCVFCATGKSGFIRDLSADEILHQVLFFARLLKKENQRVSNVVFMGMGEPLLNLENCLNAIKTLNDKDGLYISARRISISTSGIIPGIKKLSKIDLPINLALSLHAPNDQLRSRLMPINRQYRLNEVIEELKKYLDASGRKIMFEYILIDGINDTPEHAVELVNILQDFSKKLFVLNLIPANAGGGFNPSPVANIKIFKETLEKYKIPFTQRHLYGSSISAACGELAGKE